MTPTCHNQAKIEDIASTVIMPGDPLRSKFIAETFLEDAVLVNNVRGVQGYTGFYKGKRIFICRILHRHRKPQDFENRHNRQPQAKTERTQPIL